LWANRDACLVEVSISIPIVTTRTSFRPEIAVQPCDLTENVRSLEARLRAAEPEQLTAEEEQALESLLRTVHRLTMPSLNGGD
jgi:hypothetical protein